MPKTNREELLEEIASLPEEYIPFLLDVTRSLKELLENIHELNCQNFRIDESSTKITPHFATSGL